MLTASVQMEIPDNYFTIHVLELHDPTFQKPSNLKKVKIIESDGNLLRPDDPKLTFYKQKIYHLQQVGVRAYLSLFPEKFKDFRNLIITIHYGSDRSYLYLKIIIHLFCIFLPSESPLIGVHLFYEIPGLLGDQIQDDGQFKMQNSVPDVTVPQILGLCKNPIDDFKLLQTSIEYYETFHKTCYRELRIYLLAHIIQHISFLYIDKQLNVTQRENIVWILEGWIPKPGYSIQPLSHPLAERTRSLLFYHVTRGFHSSSGIWYIDRVVWLLEKIRTCPDLFKLTDLTNDVLRITMISYKRRSWLIGYLYRHFKDVLDSNSSWKTYSIMNNMFNSVGMLSYNDTFRCILSKDGDREMFLTYLSKPLFHGDEKDVKKYASNNQSINLLISHSVTSTCCEIDLLNSKKIKEFEYHSRKQFSIGEQLNALYRTEKMMVSGLTSTLLLKFDYGETFITGHGRINLSEGLDQTKNEVAASLWWYLEFESSEKVKQLFSVTSITEIDSKQSPQKITIVDFLNLYMKFYDNKLMELAIALYESIPSLIDVMIVDIVANIFLPSLYSTTHPKNIRYLRKRIVNTINSTLSTITTPTTNLKRKACV